MPSLGLGSGLANDRTRWYRDAKFGMFIHWGTIRAGQRGLLAHNDTHTSGHQRSGVSRVAKAVWSIKVRRAYFHWFGSGRRTGIHGVHQCRPKKVRAIHGNCL